MVVVLHGAETRSNRMRQEKDNKNLYFLHPKRFYWNLIHFLVLTVPILYHTQQAPRYIACSISTFLEIKENPQHLTCILYFTA
jgi:hypothetical protein